jgi:hypothetical protein
MIKGGIYTSNRTGDSVNVKGIDDAGRQKIKKLVNTGRVQKANKFADKMRIPKAPGAPVAPVDPQVTIKPIDFTPPTPAVKPPGASQDTLKTLFPSTRMFEPENYEGSPLYKFQVKEGLNQVSKSLAARGLTNSGYGIRKELDVPMMAAAQDTDRMTRVASENADRLKSFQDAEALRLERAGNAQWDRAFSLADLMASQSPWAAGLAGLNNTADLTSERGKSQANYLRDAYAKIFAAPGGGGGGGGGFVPQPLPSGPNNINITPAQIAADNASNNGWMNILTTGLGSLFGGN